MPFKLSMPVLKMAVWKNCWGRKKTHRVDAFYIFVSLGFLNKITSPNVAAWLVFVTAWLCACGKSDNVTAIAPATSAGQNNLLAPDLSDSDRVGVAVAMAEVTAAPVTASQNLSGVSLVDGGCGSTVTPANIPPQGTSISRITITFCVSLTVPDAAFVYDKSKWAVWFGANENEIYTASRLSVTDDGGLAAGASPRKGKVTIDINFAEGKLPDAFYANLETVGSRKRLRITPFLSGDGKGPADTNSRKGLSSIFMQNDAGAIKSPPKVDGVKPSDGAFVVQFSPPSSLESEDLAEGNANAGTSSLSGYLVMYWNHDECQANSAGWDFSINPAYDKTQRSLDKANYTVSRQLENCIYPGEPNASAPGPCNFGCSKSADATLFNRSAENVLQPRVIPSAFGAAGKQKYGCYTVVKVSPEQKSYGVGELENGSIYGVAVFALDSSSRVGYSRSSCARVVPRDIPLASAEKGAEIKASDCFVVTAASGNKNSAAVHYWRLIRDQLILRSSAGQAFVSWYVVHGPRFAAWLTLHPEYKPLLEKTFAFSGKLIFEGYQFGLRLAHKAHALWQKIFARGSLSALNPLAVILPSPALAQSAASKSSSGQFYLLGGVTFPTDDKDLYNAYYQNKKPLTLIAGQTFRIADFENLGQLGVGGELSYNTAKGSVPAKSVRKKAQIPAEIVGTEIGFFGLGLRATASYSLEFQAFPYLVPRFLGYLGTQLTREQAPNPQDPNTTKAEESEIKPRAADGWSMTYGLRAGVDISMVGMLGAERGTVLYAHGLEDFAFRFAVGFAKDTSTKMLRISGMQTMAGLVLAFL